MSAIRLQSSRCCNREFRRLGRWGCLALALVFLHLVNAPAGEAEFHLREQLGQTWRDQLVMFPFEAPRGACHGRSVRLIGPDGPVPVQLVDVSYFGDDATFVRAAKAAWFVDLDPGAALAFTLHYGPEPGDAPPPPSELIVERREEEVVLRNARFGTTLLLGKRSFDPPAAADDVPGPLVDMLLADGTRFGGSRMFGDARISGYCAELLGSGPVFAEVRYRYEYASGNELVLHVQFGGRDSALYFDMDVAEDAPRDGVQFVLSRGLPPLVFPVQMEFYSRRPCFVDSGAEVGDWAELPMKTYAEELVTRLTPWGDWWDDTTQTAVRFTMEGRDESLLIASRDAGAWVEPAPPGEYNTSSGRNHKMMPIRRSPDGEVFLEANLAAGEAGGVRRWLLGLPPEHTPLPDREFGRRVRNKEITERRIQQAADQRRLDVVKDYVLDWPDSPHVPHPHLFVSGPEIARVRQYQNPPASLLEQAEQLAGQPIRDGPSSQDCVLMAAWLTSGDRAMAERLKLVERLRKYLGLLGDFDLMRHPTTVAVLYDCLIKTDLVPEAEKPRLRAQMAYLAYRFADPATWSIERGYNSGNPNMSVSYILGLGILACAIPDHPQAAEWIEPALRRVDLWLDRDVGPEGEWTESAHYAHVTASTIMAFAIAAQNAGFADLSRDGRLKRLMLYLAKQYTPPDPTREGFRANPPLGRANAGARPGLAGAMARFTAETDPIYSRYMQWTWKQLGESYNIYDDRLAGAEYVYINPSLPAEQPDWQSDHFPRVGAVLRHGFGTPEEHYLNVLLNGDILFARPSEVGSVVKWFAFGRPIAGMFTGGYEHRHELLNCRVVPARAPETAEAWSSVVGRRGTSRSRTFSSHPRMDYADAEFTIEQPRPTDWARPEGMPAWPAVQREGEPPIHWRRQMLFVKGPAADEPSYLVLRDTLSGNQPTLWQFWTLSDGIVPAAEAADPAAVPRVEADKLRLPAQALEGDRFTAVGQLDVDVEYFIAAPRGTPRYTLRYGDTYTYPIQGFQEHQDLLQLRLPGDGSYYVVLFPRRRSEKPPTFRTHAGGAVIEVAGPWGTDYVLLTDGPDDVRVDDGPVLRGPAASAQHRTGRPPLVLTAH